MTTPDHDLLLRIDGRLERMEKLLLGNGQPGFCKLHEDRIATLEQHRSWMAGAIAVIGMLGLGAKIVEALAK